MARGIGSALRGLTQHRRRAMKQTNDPCSSIDPADLGSADLGSADLATVTGGWNPVKSAWNKAKEIGRDVVDGVEYGVEYVKDHPEVLIQGARMK
jgi:hypothetical protein